MDIQKKLYVKMSSLPVTDGLDKSFNAVSFLNSKDVALIGSNECASEGYAELGIALVFRTAYSNKVIIDRRNPVLYGSINMLPGTGMSSEDIIMLSAAHTLKSVFEINGTYTDFNNIMVNTQFQYRGFINLKPGIIQPLLFCQVILHDTMKHEIEKYFTSVLKWENIFNILENPTNYSVAFYPGSLLEEMLVLTGKE